MAYGVFLQIRQQFQRRLGLANEQRVSAFGVTLQKMPLSLVVQNFHLVLGANLAAFGEPPAGSEGTGERAVFGMEGGHVLVECEFQLAPVDVVQQVE